MSASINKLKKRRKIFGWVFVASFLVFLSLNLVIFQAPLDNISDKSSGIEDIPKIIKKAAGPNTATIISIISLLTSLTALLGFFSTTILAWRKEKREQLHSELEIKKKELEIQKLQTELNSQERNDAS